MSSLSWLDFNESDRKQALDIIDLFREKGTVDELGIGTVRDAIADLLFPGTSTIMTRARYYLFVPWMYLRHEGKKTPSREIAQLGRRDELALIENLVQSQDKQGVIGVQARANLRRLPSTIYWAGLGDLGIRRFQGSIENYHRAIDAFYRQGGRVVRGDDKHVVAGGIVKNWDPHIPAAPSGFPNSASLQLSADEATYLRERILQSAPQSVFAFFVSNPSDIDSMNFAWDHPLCDAMSDVNQSELQHAKYFSRTMFGAALLYNLMLADKKKHAELTQQYRDDLNDWAGLLAESEGEFAAWDRSAFWSLIGSSGARVGAKTRAFIDYWLNTALGATRNEVADSQSARTMIQLRERDLKGHLARLENNGALDRWRGASGRYELDYRWNRPVKAILTDIQRAEAAE